MFSFHKSFDKTILIPSGVKFLNDIPEFNALETNYIIYKTVTGIGATYSELEANRNSIIVLPNISIIKNKRDGHKGKHQLIPVYGELTPNQIKKHLTTKQGIVKFITTPKGLKKIYQALGEKRKDYFLLFDECHRAIQDVHYRKDILEAMEIFFLFDNKALVSATPLSFTDTRFSEHGFKTLLIKPQEVEQIPITLLTTNSIINSIKNHLDANKADCYCIFFNSVQGILNIIEKLKIEGQSNIFCSETSETLLKLKKNNRVHSDFKEGAKFNFFTSSFFNGLDVFIDRNQSVDVIIITDVYSANHSLVDPHTDVIQIAGRVRRKIADYNLIHINNAAAWTSKGSVDEARKRLDDSSRLYQAVETLKSASHLQDLVSNLNNLLTHVSPYSHMIYNNQYSYFLEDNYLNDARVSTYYNRPSNLFNAYTDSGRFIIKDKPDQYAKAEIQHITQRLLAYRRPNIKMALEALEEISLYQGTDDYYKALKAIERLFPDLLHAYQRLGLAAIVEADYNIKKIKRLLFNLDVEERKRHYPLIHLIHEEFKLNKKYLYKNAKVALQELADSLNLSLKMVGTDIHRYFETTEINVFIEGKSNSGFILLHRKFVRAQ